MNALNTIFAIRSIVSKKIGANNLEVHQPRLRNNSRLFPFRDRRRLDFEHVGNADCAAKLADNLSGCFIHTTNIRCT